MVLIAIRASLAVGSETRVTLCTDTDNISHLDVSLDVFANADGTANNLVANDTRVVGSTPSGAKCVEVGLAKVSSDHRALVQTRLLTYTADAGMGDLDFNIGLLKGLWLELLPLHAALDSLGAVCNPSLESGVVGHGERRYRVK